MDHKVADFAELRATIEAMMKDPERLAFAWVMMRFLDLGHISSVASNTSRRRYKITGIASLADVDHLIASVEDPIHVALLDLSVLGQLTFTTEGANLRFFIVQRAT